MSKSSEKLTLYQHPMSPPSMFTCMVADYIKIDYKCYEMNIMKAEHKKPWYLLVNPNGAIPAIKDVDGFCTNEGVAIARYMIESREIKTPIYPYNDKKKLARVNDAIEFIVEEVRTFALQAAGALFMAPKFMGKPMPPEAMQKFLKGRVINGYKKLEEVIKRNGGDYILGSQITLADFYATVWCILPVDLGVLTLENNPTLSKWFEKVQEVKEIKNIRNKYQAMIKKIMFFLTWIMPIIKCCTCQCCCPKKK